MKLLVAMLVLLFATSAVAQEETTQQANSIKDFLSTLNPLVFIVVGVILFFVSFLAKPIGAILILLGIVSLVLSFM